MDIQLEKKKGLQKKHIPYVAGGVLFVILLGWIIFGDHASTLKVDARGISIGNVTVSNSMTSFVWMVSATYHGRAA